MSAREVRLLLVDDDPSAIQVMSRMLAQYPEQQFATSGEAALRLARQTPPDLIVLDIDMPGMSGLDVSMALKADPALAHVPVIFATSHATPALEVAALQTGATDFVTKPLDAARLTARVRAGLRAGLLAEDPTPEARTRESLSGGPARLRLSQPIPRLLIVDDDVTAIRILQNTLQYVGEIHYARSGEEALRLASSIGPDLILLDAQMANLDGFEVCAALKAVPALEPIPIVFVTRFSDPASEMRALDLGAADFIAKPYSPAVLLARVRNLLDLGRRADAELRSVREKWRAIGDVRVASIVAGASDAIVSFDFQGHVQLANAAACLMFGRVSQQVIGLQIQALLGNQPPPTAPTAAPVRMMITGGTGDAFAAEVSLSCVGDGSDRLTTMMLRDVSVRERLESESRARIEAETTSRRIMLMLSYVAHEMGNPLNGLLGFAQLMASDTDHPLVPEQSRRLEHMLASGRILETLLRDVLDLGRFKTGHLLVDLIPVDAARSVADAVAAVSVQAGQSKVSLAVSPASPALRVIADAGRLHQCLLNLLTNAIKYNRSGGWVKIAVQRDEEGVTISVRDNGLGIDAAQREHLFEPFNRLGRQPAAAPGSGLGLVITRLLVGAMNGYLRVESEAGIGSCFSITLPGPSIDPIPGGAVSQAGATPRQPAEPR